MKKIEFIFFAFILAVGIIIATNTAVAAQANSTFLSSKSYFATSSSPGNAYIGGATVVLTAPVAGDLTVIGGTITTAASVKGDELLVAGSISARAPVKGDMRVVGGRVSVSEPISGDFVAFGYAVDVRDRIGGSIFVAAMNTTIVDGADGPVTIYGNNIFLSGTFYDDIKVVAGGRVTVGAGTHIKGDITYEAPEPANIDESAVIDGEVKYTSASYLPGANASRMLAIASIGVFLLVRILGALLLAGLLAGLFPRPAEEIVEKLSSDKITRILLTTALGFAIIVAVPVFILILALTFIGFGISALILIAYILLALLSLMGAGIVVGNMLARRFSNRDAVLWHDGVIGMLILSMATLIPYVGFWIVFLVATYTAGALSMLFFGYAFPGSDKDEGQD